ncbi:hypothetical protein KAW18_02280 [candidate division WOR-3 bacterium]|nr:hypothetical protein [candidate division WOR-3 bacterium]
MVMIFSSKKALEQLRTMGEVVTFRLKKRKVLGDDWVADRRGGRKLYDVFVDIQEENIIPDDLDDYIEGSGFKSLKEWKSEIKQLHKCDEQTKGFLYYVCLHHKKEIKENEKR